MKKLILLPFISLVINGAIAQHSPQWTQTINALPDSGDIHPVKVIDDEANNIYVLSFYYKYLSTGIQNKIYLNKYNPDGVQLWSYVFDNSGAGEPRGFDLVTGPAGECYIAGGFMDSSFNKPILMKIDSSGNFLWLRDSATAFNTRYLNKIFLVNSKLYCQGPAGIVKFDMNGIEEWSVAADAGAFAVDPSGQSVVSTNGLNGITVSRYDSTGVLNFSDTLIYFASRIAIDTDKSFYFLTDYPQYELLKYDSNGVFQWKKDSFPPPPPFGDIGYDVITDHNNDITLIGLNDTMYKFSSHGNLKWIKPMNGLDSYLISAKMIFNNFILVAGAIPDSVSYNTAVNIYNANGNVSWSGIYNSNNVQEFPVSVFANSAGIYALEDSISNTTLMSFETPLFSGNIDFNLVCVDSVWYEPTDSSFINIRIFNGNFDHMNYPTVQIISPNGDTISNRNNMFSFFAHLGNHTLIYTDSITVPGITDFSSYTFLMNDGLITTSGVIDFCLLNNISNNIKDPVMVYPNPFHEVLTIDRLDMNKNYSIMLFGIDGKIVFHETVSGKNIYNVRLDDMSKGIYILKLTDEINSSVYRLIKD
jgi:hypothetical protein